MGDASCDKSRGAARKQAAAASAGAGAWVRACGAGAGAGEGARVRVRGRGRRRRRRRRHGVLGCGARGGRARRAGRVRCGAWGQERISGAVGAFEHVSTSGVACHERVCVCGVFLARICALWLEKDPRFRDASGPLMSGTPRSSRLIGHGQGRRARLVGLCLPSACRIQLGNSRRARDLRGAPGRARKPGARRRCLASEAAAPSAGQALLLRYHVALRHHLPLTYPDRTSRCVYEVCNFVQQL